MQKMTLQEGHGFRAGDGLVIERADERPWWRRLADWILRRRPDLVEEYDVRSVDSATTITVERRTGRATDEEEGRDGPWL